MKSQSARLLAVRRVTQDNQGKKTAGIDGVKSVKPAERSVMADQTCAGATCASDEEGRAIIHKPP